MFQIVVTGPIDLNGVQYTVPQFFGPSLAGYGVVSGTYAYLAVSTASARQEGILKRLRGTPLPAWTYIAGRIGSALVIAALTSTLVLGISVVFYDLRIEPEAVPAIVVTFVVGAIAFGALGLAVAAFAPNGDAAVADRERDAAPGGVRVVGLHPARRSIDAREGRRLAPPAQAVRGSRSRTPCTRRRSPIPGRGADCSWSRCGESPAWSSRCASSRGSHANREPRAGGTN